jgi:hypothetical protein
MMNEIKFIAKMAAWVVEDGKKKLVIHTQGANGNTTKLIITFGDFQHELVSREPELPCA